MALKYKDVDKEVKDNQAIYKLATENGLNIAQARNQYYGQNDALTQAAAVATRKNTPKATNAPTVANYSPSYANNQTQQRTDPTYNQRGWLRAHLNGDKAGEAYYHAAEEANRAALGYSGGEDGSQYIPLMDNYGDFSFQSAPKWFDAYGNQITEQRDKILNRKDFSYNPEEDALFKQLRAQYNREGDRAMKNTLGEISSRTGGMASSYATSAATQANQYYAQQLADRIPELYQLAYSMHMDDLNNDRADLSMLEGASDRDYGKYRDTVGDWYKDRDFTYGVHRDDVGDKQWQTSYDRGVLESDRSFEETQRMNNFGINSQAQGNAQERIYNMIVNGGLTAEEVKAQAPELLEVSGLTALDLAAYETTRREALAAQQATASRSGGSSGGSTKEKSLSFDDAQTLFNHPDGPILSEGAIRDYYNNHMISEQEAENMLDELEAGRKHYSGKMKNGVMPVGSLWNAVSGFFK